MIILRKLLLSVNESSKDAPQGEIFLQKKAITKCVIITLPFIQFLIIEHTISCDLGVNELIDITEVLEII